MYGGVVKIPTALSPSESLPELMARRQRESGDSVYLEDARSDRTLTYTRAAAASGAWAVMLDALHIPVGGFIVLDVGDPLSFAAAYLGVIANGRCCIPVNPDSAWSDVMAPSTLVGGVSAIVSDRDEPGDSAGAALIAVVEGGLPHLVAASSTSRDTASCPASGYDGSALLFTSGSTGTPKGVELPSSELLFVADQIAAHNGLVGADRGYNPLPLFHVNAEVVGLLSTMVAGSTLVLDRRFHRTGFWQLLGERKITWLNAVPAMLAVLARGGVMDLPASLRFVRSASAPLPEAVRGALDGVDLVISYGMTEGASQITATPLGEPLRDGSVGLPVGSQVEVRSQDGEVLAAEEIGDLWVRGPGIVTRYFADRAADRFDEDGWLSTGDIGRIDADGWVYLVGRTDDVINRGGEKVYPAEVEDVLLGDARVREAVVVAEPDPILGHVPVALVMLVDATVEADPTVVLDLMTRCESALPRFKRPVEIRIVEDVPRAPTGKVQRGRLRSELAEQVGK
jgi:acyl-CoA synthetase (AMP-forming)/AMP-acid ligase II